MKIVNYEGILTKEINISFINSYINPKLYDDEKTVSINSIPVIKYNLNNSILYIENSGDFYFPISGIISKKKKNYLKIETVNSIYEIEGLTPYYNLYQYYDTYYPLGYGDKIIIKGEKIESIIGYYEESKEIL